MRKSLLFFNEDSKLLDALRKDNDNALIELYHQNRRPIASLVIRNQGTEDDVDDVLQEALVVLWERVRNGKFEYQSKLSTFIYATAKNIWFRRLVRSRREFSASNDFTEIISENPSPLEEMEENERIIAVQKAMEQIGNPCRKLLLLYYWEEQSMEKIASTLGLANPDTVKSKKYQCKKVLEKLVKNILGGIKDQ